MTDTDVHPHELDHAPNGTIWCVRPDCDLEVQRPEGQRDLSRAWRVWREGDDGY